MKVSKERIDAVEVFCSPDSSSLSPSGSSNGPSSQSDCRRLHINWSSCQTVSTSSGSTASPEQKQLDVPIKAAIFTPPVYLTRKPDLFIYSHCRVTPGTRASGLKKHPKLQRHEDTILLLYPVKKRCPYLLSDFISFAGSKCSVILSSPAHQMTKTSDQTFNRLIKSAFEVLALVLMSSCEEFFSRFFFYKSLTGFVSWGNQITGVIIVCTSQQLLWFPSVCTVQPQAVEAVSFTRGTTHKHEAVEELGWWMGGCRGQCCSKYLPEGQTRKEGEENCATQTFGCFLWLFTKFASKMLVFFLTCQNSRTSSLLFERGYNWRSADQCHIYLILCKSDLHTCTG